jgi:dTDP-glucose pyrophosphorylase
MIEKPPHEKGYPHWNNSGLFIFSKEIFSVLNSLEPSKRGELELPDAILTGIHHKNWKVRVFKMNKTQFRGDFGDIKEYESLKGDKNWITELKS